jgi:hypothetical protein
MTSIENGEPPMWVKPHESPPVVAETTRDVDPVQFQQAQAERHAPSGDESDRMDQVEHESRLPGGVGLFLDTLA